MFNIKFRERPVIKNETGLWEVETVKVSDVGVEIVDFKDAAII